MEAPATLDFESAARAALTFLHRRLGFGLWMVTRTEGDDWIVLQSEDHGYGVTGGTVFRWADSFCSRMVVGKGPRVAPRSNDIPAYAEAPIAQQVKIAAYIGVPLTGVDGEFFGTLCAIDPAEMPETLRQEQELVEIIGAMLSAILQSELRLAVETRRTEQAQSEALTDAMTGLYNRRGWTRLLTGEENRCRRYGHPACVYVIDLDDLKEMNDTRGHFAGDELITRTASLLSRLGRGQDVVARVGGDEFTLLAVECDRANAENLETRIRTALRDLGVNASIGRAMRQPAQGLEAAWQEADRAMYADKGSPSRKRVSAQRREVDGR
ncbi:MAG: sensor domain-containing diguanylate cyclase [Gemmatimonadota bacterium]|nr:sensor domain-containing diguanylate cyclase [Gemmatimonadota bacterium]